jgi:predicted O-linked N-acetylglucosamine transferase (SPINDLY family)
MDYYISSELMEPEDATDHYMEKLVLLPNLSIYYEPSIIEVAPVRREELGFRKEEILFWCCQSLFKYLPQHDDIFVDIARKLPESRFLFIAHSKSENITNKFKNRLSHVFTKKGLSFETHCHFFPHMDRTRFHAVNSLADVFLDSIGWSGCNSTFESIYHNIPVVTMKGELMRGRHSAAILEMMGVTETIVSTKDEYFRIAVRLGSDSEFRRKISTQIKKQKEKIYRDDTAVRSLESFLLSAVKNHSTMTDP